MREILGQWPQIARQFLEQIGHPLRPCAEDLTFFQNNLPAPAAGKAQCYEALILGVTPELYRLTWPETATVYGADRTVEMIDYVWPGQREHVFHMNWLDLGQIGKKFDVILCDGGWHLLSYPEQQAGLAKVISELLKPGGRFLTRLFVPPAVSEPVADVLDSLLAGAIPSLNHLKIRLGTALQLSPVAGVRLGDVWNVVQRVMPDRGAFAERVGWDLRHLDAIDAYRGSDAHYHFVELSRVVDVFSRQAIPLIAEEIYVPGYAMGSQFPLLSLQRSPFQSDASVKT